MRKRRSARTLVVVIAVFATVTVTLLASSAEAQRRSRSRRFHVRPAVRLYGHYYTPYLGFYYGPFYGPAYYHPYYARYGDGYAPHSSLRIQGEPVETEVYVNGYYAGVVDDFDGYFQRLRLPPGEYEIELYLEGYKSARKTLRLSPGATYKIQSELEALPPGEPDEARPIPREPPEQVVRERESTAMTHERPHELRDTAAPRTAPTRFGILALSVQPADATLVLDGQPWPAPEGWERLTIHLSAGLHRVRVEKEGFTAFDGEVDVRPSDTTALNVQLSSNEPNREGRRSFPLVDSQQENTHAASLQ